MKWRRRRKIFFLHYHADRQIAQIHNTMSDCVNVAERRNLTIFWMTFLNISRICKNGMRTILSHLHSRLPSSQCHTCQHIPEASFFQEHHHPTVLKDSCAVSWLDGLGNLRGWTQVLRPPKLSTHQLRSTQKVSIMNQTLCNIMHSMWQNKKHTHHPKPMKVWNHSSNHLPSISSEIVQITDPQRSNPRDLRLPRKSQWAWVD